MVTHQNHAHALCCDLLFICIGSVQGFKPCRSVVQWQRFNTHKARPARWVQRQLQQGMLTYRNVRSSIEAACAMENHTHIGPRHKPSLQYQVSYFHF